MTIDLRKESPVDNVNRILAVESLVKHYPIDLVQSIDPRVVHSWTELDDEDKETQVRQIDLAFCLFGLPTAELKHLMTKLSKEVLEKDIIPQDNLSSPEEKLTNRQKLQKEFEERQAQLQAGTDIDSSNNTPEVEKSPLRVV